MTDENARKALALFEQGGGSRRSLGRALRRALAEHERVLAELAAASESASSMTRWGADQRDRADAAEARLSAVAEVIERHARIERHNDKVPLSNLSELKREPTSAEYRAALYAADKGRREQATNQEIGSER